MSLDLNTLKDQIQSVLEAANTTTAAVDLSSGIANSKRVLTIKKINPDLIPSDLTIMPLVTVYLDSKTVTPQTIAKNQATGKRMGELDFKIMGIVYNDNHSTDDEDPAQEDIEHLMENIEQIFRNNPTFSGTIALTSMPTEVQYFSGAFRENEQTHIRGGLMTLNVKTFY